ncbi:MAG TPA: hypothetical protein DCW90_20200 [Lachnospiraceae bacterium]|nr:hypothetical protein [Lachnospiraceae bacterium]
MDNFMLCLIIYILGFLITFIITSIINKDVLNEEVPIALGYGMIWPIILLLGVIVLFNKLSRFIYITSHKIKSKYKDKIQDRE